MDHPLPPGWLQDAGEPLEGLGGAQAGRLLAQHGANDVLPQPGRTRWPALRQALGDPMVWFLAGAATLYALLGERVEAVVLAIALVPILGMDAWLHRRTQASLGALALPVEAAIRVHRDGQWMSLDAIGLVPGDLVALGPGQYVPADGLVVEASTDAQVDESSLTGEFLAAAKTTLPPGPWPPVGPVEHPNWLMAGSQLLVGHVQMRVAWTGARTLYGGLVRTARTSGMGRTPLQDSVARLVRWLVLAALVLCGVLAAARMLQGHGPIDALLSAATLAIAALPEEFPIVLALFLGLGAVRLAKQRVQVRRAVAVEDIGRIDHLCTDKTGTLTTGQMALARVIAADGIAADAVAGAARATAVPGTDDPLDRALLESATAVEGRIIERRPFDPIQRRATAVIESADGRMEVTKGAPETILALCARPDEVRAEWDRHLTEASSRGQRVIACARRAVSADLNAPEPPFTLMGLLVFDDPLRDDATATVARAQANGIRVIMLTGDSPGTARAIAQAAGIGGRQPRVASGTDVARQLDRDESSVLDRLDVVARCLPEHKARIVGALRAHGGHVAVTGDGINDIPALRAANVGVAMGRRGSRSTREVADIVLLDDRLSSLVDAITGGRRLFANLRASFTYLILIHIPFVLAAALVPLFGTSLMLLPIHVVWMELIIHPTALLAFQDTRRRLGASDGERPLGRRMFGPGATLQIAIAGAVMAVLVSGGYLVALAVLDSAGQARAVGIGMLILGSASLTLALGGSGRAQRWIAALSAASLPIALAVPALRDVLHLAVPPLWGWLLMLAAAVGFAALARPTRRRIRRLPRAAT